ncbi:MAG: hypothetical protein ACW99Q_27345, partial [Candidatus Kariarchaeaceae archaeon]
TNNPRNKLGNRQFLTAIYEDHPSNEFPVGGLNIIYAPGAFMSVDRIIYSNNKFQKQRRIIYYLDSRPGQIGCTLLLQLLKIKNGEEFSKHKFVQRIDEDFFQSEGINISSGDINEALSRMFRKTMVNFFEVNGRVLVRKNFTVTIQEFNLRQNSQNTYSMMKRDIDQQANQFIRNLNRLI